MFMNRRRQRSITCRLLAAILFLPYMYAFAIPEPNPRDNNERTSANRVLLLLVLDFSDFNCPLCLDSLLNFCRMLPPNYSGVSVWGIVVNNKDQDKNQNSLSIQIMEKRIRGFIEANDIGFPLVLDRHGMFNRLSHQGSTLMVLDFKKQIVSSYDFPLESQEIQHIQQILFLQQY